MYDYSTWKPKQVSGPQVHHPAAGGNPAALLNEPLSLQQRMSKRCFDVVVSFALLAFLLPFLLLVAAALWIESGRPLLFRQRRGGLGGRPFTIFKFRTMRVLEDGPAVAQACKGDPRVTRIGALLRRTSIDELPQLLNVLRGDMSLVGPRPHALVHDEHFSVMLRHYPLRQRVKPGLTGLAQIEGWRGETATIDAIAGRVNADIRYIDNWSFWLDLKIIVRTACVVLFDRSAY